MAQDDAELLVRASRGDHSAFAALYRRYEADLYRFVIYLADGPDTAEELFQDTWFRVVRSLGKTRVTDFKKWIFAIATNLYRDELRKRKVRRLFLGAEPVKREYGDTTVPHHSHVLAAESEAAAREASSIVEDLAVREALRRAMRKLTSRQRMVFTLTQIERFKIREVAEMLGKSEGTVKSTLHRALEILRTSLKEFR